MDRSCCTETPPQKIDRLYKIYRIDLLPPHPVNLVNPVYFHCFWASPLDVKAPRTSVGQTGLIARSSRKIASKGPRRDFHSVRASIRHMPYEIWLRIKLQPHRSYDNRCGCFMTMDFVGISSLLIL